jgi:30S ribosomal protein S31
MGRGDIKSKKGKISSGSYGKSRLTQRNKAKAAKAKAKKA